MSGWDKVIVAVNSVYLNEIFLLVDDIEADVNKFEEKSKKRTRGHVSHFFHCLRIELLEQINVKLQRFPTSKQCVLHSTNVRTHCSVSHQLTCHFKDLVSIYSKSIFFRGSYTRNHCDILWQEMRKKGRKCFD